MYGALCPELDSQTASLGDAHYHQMGVWLKSRLDQGFYDAAFGTAVAYRQSLGLLIECLQKQPPSTNRWHKLETTHALFILVEKDIEILLTHGKPPV